MRSDLSSKSLGTLQRNCGCFVPCAACTFLHNRINSSIRSSTMASVSTLLFLWLLPIASSCCFDYCCCYCYVNCISSMTKLHSFSTFVVLSLLVFELFVVEVYFCLLPDLTFLIALELWELNGRCQSAQNTFTKCATITQEVSIWLTSPLSHNELYSNKRPAWRKMVLCTWTWCV